MSTKRSIILELGDTTTAGGVAKLITNQLRPGQSLAVQIVSLRSEDTDTVVANIGVLRGTTLARLETIAMTSKATTYLYHHPIWLESNAQLQIDITAGGNKVPVRAWVFGYLTDDL